MVPLHFSVGEGEVELPYWSVRRVSLQLVVSKADLTIQLPVVPPIPALPISAQDPSEEDETMVWISMLVGGSGWLKLSSALRHLHVLQTQTED